MRLLSESCVTESLLRTDLGQSRCAIRLRMRPRSGEVRCSPQGVVRLNWRELLFGEANLCTPRFSCIPAYGGKEKTVVDKLGVPELGRHEDRFKNDCWRNIAITPTSSATSR